MDNFQAVALEKGGFSPTVTRYDLAIQFNRNPVGLHAEVLDQGGQSGDLVNITFGAIDH